MLAVLHICNEGLVSVVSDVVNIIVKIDWGDLFGTFLKNIIMWRTSLDTQTAVMCLCFQRRRVRHKANYVFYAAHYYDCPPVRLVHVSFTIIQLLVSALLTSPLTFTGNHRHADRQTDRQDRQTDRTVI